MDLVYCKKCGRVVSGVDYNGHHDSNKKCDCCGSATYSIPKKYWLNNEINTWITDEQQELLREELVKTSSEFDQYLFDNREKILREKSSGDPISFYKENGEIKARVVGSDVNVPKCPTCGSTNVQKITGLERGISVATLGLFSKKINKSFKCNNCGYTW